MLILKLLWAIFAGYLGVAATVSDLEFESPAMGSRLTLHRPTAIAKRTQDKPTVYFSRLKPVRGSLAQRSAAYQLGHYPGNASRSQHINPVGSFSAQYAIQCSWDRIPTWLLFDTGSSDSWTVSSKFRCHDSSGKVSAADACGFGKTNVGAFGQGPIDDLHFHLKYGDGEEVWGPMGYSALTCGGLEVPKQQVGLANNTFWKGDNTTVGLLGLAYPSLTTAFYGALGDEAEYNQVTYKPFFTNAWSQGSIDPIFSIALMKNTSEGVIAWGGLPPMDLHQNQWAETDILVARFVDYSNTAWKYSFYTIMPTGIRWDNTVTKDKYPYIVDTGTTLIYLPPPLAEEIANAFQPRAVYLYEWGGYFAPCDAVPPRFAVIISGVEFWINPAHMIFTDVVDPLTGYCSIAISSGEEGPYILGDVFLQNVVAVFDVGAAVMRFYPRKL